MRLGMKYTCLRVGMQVLVGLKYYKDFQNRIPRREVEALKDVVERVAAEIDSDLVVSPLTGIESFPVRKHWHRLSVECALVVFRRGAGGGTRLL
jgi:hypothetical protein